MKTSATLSVVAGAAVAAAHGIVSNLDIGGDWYDGYDPFTDPYMSPEPELIVWNFPGAGNGPVTDVTSDAITCNLNATAAPLTAPVAAGDKVDFFWTTWPSSHKGPVMTYMALCSGNCSDADAQSLSFFKIDEAGLINGTMNTGTWASDELIANNNSWTVTIPSSIKAGNYLIRHEILALHSAGTAGGAQFYPMCANLQVTGSGTDSPTGVKFPGAYSETDPGITVNIYTDATNYTIPGPALYSGASSSDGSGSSTGSSSAVASSAVTSSAVASSAVASSAAATTAAATSAASTAAVEATSSSAEAATSVAATSSAAESFSNVASSAATSAAATTVDTTAIVATTMVTSTTAVTSAAGTTTAAGAASSGSSSGETMNQCLDKVNACIAAAQSKTGGTVDFSSCDDQRTACYSMSQNKRF